MSPGRTSNGLPVTAYLVLGVLAANDEQLTAGEIKTRAELSVGHFYWSPSVSHVRRELNRLLARGMVSEIGAQSGKRAITLYEATDSGLEALRRWVQHFPGQDQVVIKHPVILEPGLPAARIQSTSSTRWIGISRQPGRGWTRRCGRGSVPAISASSTIRTSVSPSPSSITRSAGCTRRSRTLRNCATRSPRDRPGSRQAGATAEGADPPPRAQA